MNKKIKKIPPSIIVTNKRAYYDYFIEEKYEAGLSLQGWEVKALRAGSVSINNSYIAVYSNEALLLGANIVPLDISSNLQNIVPTRERKVLLKRRPHQCKRPL